jgi:hypothetical protein
LKQSTVAITSPQSAASSQHMLRRGNSAENLHASVQQHVNPRLDTQNGAAAPNGTLKKLKTGKEQVSSCFSFLCCC